jgi:hypothetical protein
MSLAKDSPILARLESLQKYTENKGLEGGDLVPALPGDPFSPPAKEEKREDVFSR